MKQTYTSIFSPDKKVTPAQYISELVCKNRATNLKMELPTQFWEAPEWLNYYKVQLLICYKYLKRYDAEVLIKVVRNKNIWALTASWINNEFAAEQLKVSNQVIEQVNHDRVTDSVGSKKKKKDFGFLDG